MGKGAFRSKYHAKPTVYGGVRYHSKKEAWHAWGLDQAIKAGELIRYERQVPYELPGGVFYFLDFKEYWNDPADKNLEEIRYVDVKGIDTPVSRLKRKQTEAIYGIRILLA